ncbi:MAG: hypothetical protein V7724_17075 [Sediminicola sp.]
MTYKIKSLLYLVGFVAAASLYQSMEPDSERTARLETIKQMNTTEMDSINKLVDLEEME